MTTTRGQRRAHDKMCACAGTQQQRLARRDRVIRCVIAPCARTRENERVIFGHGLREPGACKRATFSPRPPQRYTHTHTHVIMQCSRYYSQSQTAFFFLSVFVRASVICLRARISCDLFVRLSLSRVTPRGLIVFGFVFTPQARTFYMLGGFCFVAD